MLYKKVVLWEDLNIKLSNKTGEDVYGHVKLVDMHNKIADFKTRLKYLPSRLFYEPTDPEKPGEVGFYSQGMSVQSSNCQTLECMTMHVLEMEQIVK